MRCDKFNPGQVATLGLSSTANSLDYRVAEIEKHLHTGMQVYGGTTATTIPTLVRNSLVPTYVTGAAGAWGTQLILHNGTVIEAGDAAKKFDANTCFIRAVGTANRDTVLDFYSHAIGTPIAYTSQESTDTLTKATHGLLDNDMVVLASVVTNTEFNVYTCYYVVNKAENTFQLSLTRGGAAITFAADGSGTYYSLGASDADGVASGQTWASSLFVFRTNTDTDSRGSLLPMARIACNRALTVRAKSLAAGTNTVQFYLGLHTYTA